MCEWCTVCRMPASHPWALSAEPSRRLGSACDSLKPPTLLLSCSAATYVAACYVAVPFCVCVCVCVVCCRYGEYYSEGVEGIRTFHEALPQLLAPGGVYSYFNGFASDNFFFHMVYGRWGGAGVRWWVRRGRYVGAWLPRALRKLDT